MKPLSSARGAKSSCCGAAEDAGNDRGETTSSLGMLRSMAGRRVTAVLLLADGTLRIARAQIQCERVLLSAASLSRNVVLVHGMVF
jgi:hypothetical protein